MKRPELMEAARIATAKLDEQKRAEKQAGIRLKQYDNLSSLAFVILEAEEMPYYSRPVNSSGRNGRRRSRIPGFRNKYEIDHRHTGAFPIDKHPDTNQELFGRLAIKEIYRGRLRYASSVDGGNYFTNHHSTGVLAGISVGIFMLEGQTEISLAGSASIDVDPTVILNDGLPDVDKAAAIRGDIPYVHDSLMLLAEPLGISAP